ncbi:uncharacterized protein [Centruroides vittatus]|uniref:uncharacterized protein n=1 Tax=Centruroides vittatus TaxID=120091 RepID=UPI00350F8EAC
MKQYQQWFGNEIMYAWFQDGVQSCINWMDDSLRMDKLEPISNDVQTGTSLMDLNDSVFHTIFIIWEILDWFDIAATRKLIESLNDYFSYYAMQLVTKLEKENYYYTPSKPENSFRPKLLVALNNLAAIDESLEFIVGKIENNSNFQSRSGTEKNILLVLKEPFPDVRKGIEDISREIVDKITLNIKNSLSNIRKATNENRRKKAINHLLYYIENDLNMTYKRLNSTVYKSILFKLWNEIIQILQTSLNECKPKIPKFCSMSLCKRKLKTKDLWEISEGCLLIFNANEGLSYSDMKNENYTKFKSELVYFDLSRKNDKKISS